MPVRAQNDFTADKTRAELLADLDAAGFDNYWQIGNDITEGDITRAVYDCSWRVGSRVRQRNCQMQIKKQGVAGEERAAWEASSARWLADISRERQLALETIWPKYIEAVEAGYNFGGNDGSVCARWPDPNSVRVILDNDGETAARRYGIIEFQEQIATGSTAELDPAADGSYEIKTRRIIYNRDTTNNQFTWRVYDYVAPPIGT